MLKMEDTASRITQFGQHLHFFMWIEVKDSSMVRDMNNTANFAGKHEEAAGSYLKWLKDGYPKVKLESRESQKQQHLTNLYNIFVAHCPDHPIFDFIDDEE